MRAARRLAGFAAAVLAAAWLAGCGADGGPAGGAKAAPPGRAAMVSGPGEAVGVRAAASPARVLGHYGFGGGDYRPYAVVDFGGAAVGAAVSGTVERTGDGAVDLKLADGTRLAYRGLARVFVGPGEAVRAGDPLGEAGGPVELSAEKGGRALDPVALLWPEMSRFAAEAAEIERKRAEWAARIRERARAARAGRELDALFARAARETGLDPALLKAVASVESGFDPRAVSPKGATGVMQLMPETAKALGVSDPFDPAENVRAGARHLRDLLKRFGGDLELALAAYNAGAEAVERYGGVPPYPETQRYVRAVLEAYRDIRARMAAVAER